MEKIKIKVKKIRPEADADIPLPRYMTEASSGLDLAAAVEKTLVILPGRIVLVPTGLALAVPPGFEAQVRPRSGLALKKGLTIINTPGTIDADYRGEVGLAMVNLGPEPVEIKRGDRVAQLVLTRVWQADLELVAVLDETERGPGGFGHTD
ncbi:MAG: dUTP diphosphatase [Pseudomonadota bacterium]